MKKSILVVLVAMMVLAFSGVVQALPTEIIAWDTYGLSGNEDTLASFSNAASVSAADMTRGSGLLGVTWVSDALSFRHAHESTLADAIADNDYWEFTVTPNSAIDIHGVEMEVMSNDMAMSCALMSDVTGGFTDGNEIETKALPDTLGVRALFDLSGIAALQDRTDPVTFRIYFWGKDGQYNGTFIGTEPGAEDASGDTEEGVWDVAVWGPDDGLPFPSSNPTPAVGATQVPTTQPLTWTAGQNATSHDVYFGTTETLTAADFQGNLTTTTFAPTLAENTEYFWRVDEVNATGTTEGEVWAFKTFGTPDPAYGPTPGNGANISATTVTLAWNAGANTTTSHKLYFGTSAELTAADLATTLAVTSTTYDVLNLEYSTTYYWRIDEVNSFGFTTGTVWSFNSPPPPPLVGFDCTGLNGDEASLDSFVEDPGLKGSTLTRGDGLAGAGWYNDIFHNRACEGADLAAAVDGNDYLTFTVEPEAGKAAWVDSLVGDFTALNDTNVAIMASTTGSFTEADAIGTAVLFDKATRYFDNHTWDLSGVSALQGFTEAVEIRIYLWGHTSTGYGTFGVGFNNGSSPVGEPNLFLMGRTGEPPTSAKVWTLY